MPHLRLHQATPTRSARGAGWAWLIPVLAAATLAGADAESPATHAPLPTGMVGETAGPVGRAGDPQLYPSVEVPLRADGGAAEPAAGPDTGKSDFVAAPMPFVNPTIGAGLGAVGMLLFPAGGRDAPPSKVAVGGMASQNHSWGAFAGAKLHLLDDSLRLGLATGHLDLRYDYFGIGEEQNESGLSVPLRQRIDFAMTDCLFRVAPRIFAGPTLSANRSRIAIDSDLPQGLPAPGDATIASGALGVHLQYDSRDDTIYPTMGVLSDVNISANTSVDGGNVDYRAGKVAVNGYREVLPRSVLCGRFFTSFVDGDAPFYALSCMGRGSDLRGYVDGRYRDNILVATQAEWRWMATGSFGMVGFAGVGEVASDAGDLSLDPDRLLPSVGGGLRWRLSQKFPMSLRLDVAWGKDDGMFYVSMGEAF